MTDRKTIAFFPEASFGAALNCVGIAQKLRDMGHEAVFLCDAGFAGTFEAYGFREYPITMTPDLSEEELEKFWSGFIARHLPHFRLTPAEQLTTYAAPCWEAIVDSAILAEPHLERQLATIRPDVVCVDNVVLFPATTRANCPWVRIVSCAETEIPDPDIPPLMSGLGLRDKPDFAGFSRKYTNAVEPAHNRYNAFLHSVGLPEYPAGQFFEKSPHLNLMLYTEALRFKRKHKLDSKKYLYLEGCVRKESQFNFPEFPAHNEKPVVYISFGSLGAADIALFERMVRLFSTLPYRFLINAGGYKDSYRYVPDNVHIDYWYPQPSVVERADLFIHHGGNNSVHEALYYGIPSIVMPYCWDGHDNAARMAETGIGVHMDRYDWRDAEMTDTIDRLISDHKLKKRLEKISSAMQAADSRTKAAEAILAICR